MNAGFYEELGLPPPNTEPLTITTFPLNYTEPTRTAELPTAQWTHIGDNPMPVLVPTQTNAASSNVLGSSNVAVGGLGGLGTVTVLLVLYNLFSGVGLGVMLWKGIIDWKGNIIAHITATRAVITTPATNNANPTTITVRDEAGIEWFVPLTWVDSAITRIRELGGTNNRNDNNDNGINISNATIQLEGYEGATGRLRLEAMMEAAAQTMRLRAAGLVD